MLGNDARVFVEVVDGAGQLAQHPQNDIVDDDRLAVERLRQAPEGVCFAAQALRVRRTAAPSRSPRTPSRQASRTSRRNAWWWAATRTTIARSGPVGFASAMRSYSLLVVQAPGWRSSAGRGAALEAGSSLPFPLRPAWCQLSRSPRGRRSSARPHLCSGHNYPLDRRRARRHRATSAATGRPAFSVVQRSSSDTGTNRLRPRRTSRSSSAPRWHRKSPARPRSPPPPRAG